MTTQTQAVQGLDGPLSNDNKLKIGTFGSNAERANAMTKIPGALKAEWQETKWAAQEVDRMGFEAIVPLARWKGVGGETNFNGRAFDVMAWAAGIAEATEQAMVFSTVNVGLTNPIMAAKQLATIDHISGGRAALNVVAGWFRPEVEMFGKDMAEHDARYDLADEFTDILKLLWSNQPFEEVSYDGDHFKLVEGYSEPQPVRKPYIPIMNAGSSERSMEYTAKHADLAFIFVGSDDLDEGKAQVKALKDRAAEQGRELQVWVQGYIVSRDTDAEAEEYLRWYAEENGDAEAAENTMRIAGMETALFDKATMDTMKRRFIAGSSGFEMLGSPDRVVERLQFVSDIGCDGALFSWPDWREDMPYFEREILPRLEQAGLRRPFEPKA